MNIPSVIKDYCPKCNGHREHKLKHYKAKSPRGLSWGTRQNEATHKSGYKGQAEFVAKVRKQTKKFCALATCQVCGRKHYFVIGKRMKKVEIQSS